MHALWFGGWFTALAPLYATTRNSFYSGGIFKSSIGCFGTICTVIRSSIWAEATCYKLTHLIHISKGTMAIMTTMISSSNTTEITIATITGVVNDAGSGGTVPVGLDSTDADEEMLFAGRCTKST